MQTIDMKPRWTNDVRKPFPAITHKLDYERVDGLPDTSTSYIRDGAYDFAKYPSLINGVPRTWVPGRYL